MTRWVALLRGVNVGGANRLPMADLRATIEGLGCSGVVTYIQSGNVVFDEADGWDEREVTARIRVVLADRHGLEVPVVVRNANEIAEVADRHPDVDGSIDPKFLFAVFLDRSPEPDVVSAVAVDGFGADRFVVDGREVFVTYPNGSGRSKLTIDVFERRWGVIATARNLNTVRKLAELAELSGRP